VASPRLAASSAAAAKYRLAEPAKPDPRDAIIRQLNAQLEAAAAERDAAKAADAEKAGRIERAKAALGQ
jgi:hypothetical protein